jgi:hypothetical protein
MFAAAHESGFGRQLSAPHQTCQLSRVQETGSPPEQRDDFMRAFDPLAAIGATTDKPHEEEAKCFGSSVRVVANGMKVFLAFGAEAPLYYYFIPEAERSARCKLTTNTCIVDGEHFFVRGSLEIPVHDADEPFIWGVWVSLSPRN